MRFAASLPGVEVVLSGMSTLAQVEDNTAYMVDFKSLDDKDHALLAQVAEVIRQDTAIACTGCRYCATDCPRSRLY